MAGNFKLEIITPSKNFYSGQVEHVICRTTEGFEGFMADHTWTCKLLDSGVIRFKESGASDNEWKIANAKGGFIYTKGDVIIYTDDVEWN